MAAGPGVYDDICTEVRLKAKAKGAIVVIFGGEHGDGFSVQANLATTLALADILEDIAKQIRQSGPF